MKMPLRRLFAAFLTLSLTLPSPAGAGPELSRRPPAASRRPPGRPPAVLSLGPMASLFLAPLGARLPWSAKIEKDLSGPALRAGLEGTVESELSAGLEEGIDPLEIAERLSSSLVRQGSKLKWNKQRLRRALKQAQKEKLVLGGNAVQRAPQATQTEAGRELARAFRKITTTDRFPEYKRSWPVFLEKMGVSLEEVFGPNFKPILDRGFSVYVDLERDKRGRLILDPKKHVLDSKKWSDKIWKHRKIRNARTVYLVNYRRLAKAGRNQIMVDFRRGRLITNLPAKTYDPSNPTPLALAIPVADPLHNVQSAERMESGRVVYPFNGQMRIYVNPPFLNGQIPDGTFFYRAVTRPMPALWKKIARLNPKEVFATHVQTRRRENSRHVNFRVGKKMHTTTAAPAAGKKTPLLTVQIDTEALATGEPVPLTAWEMVSEGETPPKVFPQSEESTLWYDLHVDPELDETGRLRDPNRTPEAHSHSQQWFEAWEEAVPATAKTVVIQGVSTVVIGSNETGRREFRFGDDSYSTVPVKGRRPSTDPIPVQITFSARDPHYRPQQARRADTGKLLYPAPEMERFYVDPVDEQSPLFKAVYEKGAAIIRAAFRAAKKQVVIDNVSTRLRHGTLHFRDPLTKKFHNALGAKRVRLVFEKKEGKKKSKEVWTLAAVFNTKTNEKIPFAGEDITDLREVLLDPKTDVQARIRAVSELHELGYLHGKYFSRTELRKSLSQPAPLDTTSDRLLVRILREIIMDYHEELFSAVGLEPFMALTRTADRQFPGNPSRYWFFLFGIVDQAANLKKAEARDFLHLAAQKLASAGLEEQSGKNAVALAMTRLGLNQSEFGKALSKLGYNDGSPVGQTTVSNWKTGYRPIPKMARQLFHFLYEKLAPIRIRQVRKKLKLTEEELIKVLTHLGYRPKRPLTPDIIQAWESGIISVPDRVLDLAPSFRKGAATLRLGISRSSLYHDPRKIAERLMWALLELDLPKQDFFDSESGRVLLSPSKTARILGGRPTDSALRTTAQDGTTLMDKVNKHLSEGLFYDPEIPTGDLPNNSEAWFGRELWKKGVRKIEIARSRDVDTSGWTEQRLTRAVRAAQKAELSFRPKQIQEGAQAETPEGLEIKRAYSQIVRTHHFPKYRRNWLRFLKSRGIPPEEAYGMGTVIKEKGTFRVYVNLKRDSRGVPLVDEKQFVAELTVNRLESLWKNPRVRRAKTLFLVGVGTTLSPEGIVQFRHNGSRRATHLPAEQFDRKNPFKVILEVAVKDPHHEVQAARRMETGEIVYPFDGQVRFYVDPPFRNRKISEEAFLFRAIAKVMPEFWAELRDLHPQAVYATHVRTVPRAVRKNRRQAYFKIGSSSRATSIRLPKNLLPKNRPLLTARIDIQEEEALEAWKMTSGHKVFPRNDLAEKGPFEILLDPSRNDQGLVPENVKPDFKTRTGAWEKIWGEVVPPEATEVVVRGVRTQESDRGPANFIFEGEFFSTSISRGEGPVPLELTFLAQDPGRRVQQARRRDTGEVVYPAPDHRRIRIRGRNRERKQENRLFKAAHAFSAKSVQAALRAADQTGVTEVHFENIPADKSPSGFARFLDPISVRRHSTSQAYTPGTVINGVAIRNGVWRMTRAFVPGSTQSIFLVGRGSNRLNREILSDPEAGAADRLEAAEQLLRARKLNGSFSVDLLASVVRDYHAAVFNELGKSSLDLIISGARRRYRNRPAAFLEKVSDVLRHAESLPAMDAERELAHGAERLNPSRPSRAGLEEPVKADTWISRLTAVSGLLQQKGWIQSADAFAGPLKEAWRRLPHSNLAGDGERRVDAEERFLRRRVLLRDFIRWLEITAQGSTAPDRVKLLRQDRFNNKDGYVKKALLEIPSERRLPPFWVHADIVRNRLGSKLSLSFIQRIGTNPQPVLLGEIRMGTDRSLQDRAPLLHLDIDDPSREAWVEHVDMAGAWGPIDKPALDQFNHFLGFVESGLSRIPLASKPAPAEPADFSREEFLRQYPRQGRQVPRGADRIRLFPASYTLVHLYSAGGITKELDRLLNQPRTGPLSLLEFRTQWIPARLTDTRLPAVIVNPDLVASPSRVVVPQMPKTLSKLALLALFGKEEGPRRQLLASWILETNQGPRLALATAPAGRTTAGLEENEGMRAEWAKFLQEALVVRWAPAEQSPTASSPARERRNGLRAVLGAEPLGLGQESPADVAATVPESPVLDSVFWMLRRVEPALADDDSESALGSVVGGRTALQQILGTMAEPAPANGIRKELQQLESELGAWETRLRAVAFPPTAPPAGILRRDFLKGGGAAVVAAGVNKENGPLRQNQVNLDDMQGALDFIRAAHETQQLALHQTSFFYRRVAELAFSIRSMPGLLARLSVAGETGGQLVRELVAQLTSLQGWLAEPAKFQNVEEVKQEGIRIALDRPQEYHPWLRSQTAVALLESYGVEGVNPKEELKQSFRFSDTEDYPYLQSLAQRYGGRIPAVAWVQERLRVKGVPPDGLAEEVEFRLLEDYNNQWDSGLALLNPDQGLPRKILRQGLGLKMETSGDLLLGRAWRTGLAAAREQLKQEFGKFSTGLLEASRPSLEDDRSIPNVLNYLLNDGRAHSAQHQARFLSKKAVVSLPAGDRRTMDLELGPLDQEPPLPSVWKEWLSKLVSMAALGSVEVVVHTASTQDFEERGTILHAVRWKAEYAKNWTNASEDLAAVFSKRLQRGMPVWPGTLYHLQIPQGVLPASLARFLESKNWRRQFPSETDGQIHLKVPVGKTLEDHSASTAGPLTELRAGLEEPLTRRAALQRLLTGLVAANSKLGALVNLAADALPISSSSVPETISAASSSAAMESLRGIFSALLNGNRLSVDDYLSEVTANAPFSHRLDLRAQWARETPVIAEAALVKEQREAETALRYSRRMTDTATDYLERMADPLRKRELLAFIRAKNPRPLQELSDDQLASGLVSVIRDETTRVKALVENHLGLAWGRMGALADGLSDSAAWSRFAERYSPDFIPEPTVSVETVPENRPAPTGLGETAAKEIQAAYGDNSYAVGVNVTREGIAVALLGPNNRIERRTAPPEQAWTPPDGNLNPEGDPNLIVQTIVDQVLQAVTDAGLSPEQLSQVVVSLVVAVNDEAGEGEVGDPEPAPYLPAFNRFSLSSALRKGIPAALAGAHPTVSVFNRARATLLGELSPLGGELSGEGNEALFNFGAGISADMAVDGRPVPRSLGFLEVGRVTIGEQAKDGWHYRFLGREQQGVRVESTAAQPQVEDRLSERALDQRAAARGYENWKDLLQKARGPQPENAATQLTQEVLIEIGRFIAAALAPYLEGEAPIVPRRTVLAGSVIEQLEEVLGDKIASVIRSTIYLELTDHFHIPDVVAQDISNGMRRSSFRTRNNESVEFAAALTLLSAAGVEERTAKSVNLLGQVAPAVSGSVGDAALVFREPETFDLAALAVRWGWSVAVLDDGPEADALNELLDALPGPKGRYAVGLLESSRFLEGYPRQVLIEDRPEGFRILGLRWDDLPPPVAGALESVLAYLDRVRQA